MEQIQINDLVSQRNNMAFFFSDRLRTRIKFNTWSLDKDELYGSYIILRNQRRETTIENIAI